jgi:hypothetical protein
MLVMPAMNFCQELSYKSYQIQPESQLAGVGSEPLVVKLCRYKLLHISKHYLYSASTEAQRGMKMDMMTQGNHTSLVSSCD